MKVSELLFEERRMMPRPVWDGVYAGFKKEALRIKSAGADIKAARDWVEKTGNLENKWTFVMTVKDDNAKKLVKDAFDNIVAAGKEVGSTVKVADTIAVFGTSGKPSSVDQLESVTMDYHKIDETSYWLGIKFNNRAK